ncbi:MAG: hypothetical protein Q4F27_03035, partial [Desulfovibrionaceae bacterium]|nr:hypothetical protein [Desulfovibrionaceae bacterium]
IYRSSKQSVCAAARANQHCNVICSGGYAALRVCGSIAHRQQSRPGTGGPIGGGFFLFCYETRGPCEPRR